MTDRSVQVTIGAVLASTFRSSFREAQAEVGRLSRSLDTLGGRRSNAGLLSVRDASTATRTALRGLRTEITATTRALDTLPARATRVGSVMRTLASDARSAATAVQGLNTAMRGVGGGSGATNLGRINTAARNSATGIGQLRRESRTLSGVLTTLDGRLNRTATSLRTFGTAATAASRSVTGLNREMMATSVRYQSVATEVNAAATATRHMTGEINSQIASLNRLNAVNAASRRPAGGYGGGGGYGGSRGGGGGHGNAPIGAQAGMHMLFGAVGSGIIAGRMVHGAWENASDYAHQMAMRTVQGWNREELDQLQRQASDISKMVGNIADKEILKTAGHLQLAFGDRAEALHHLAALSQSTSLLKWATPDINGEENSYGMVKALEQMGRAKDPQNFDRLIERFTAATIASGGKFNGQQLFQMVGRSGAAASNLSDNFLTSYMPSIIQELGGSQAGNTLSMVRSALIGGRMTRGAAQTWDSLGLLDRSQSDPTMTTPFDNRHGNIRMRHHGRIGNYTSTQVGRAGVVDSELLQSDPGAWVQRHLVTALENNKVTDPEQIGKMMTQLFSNKSAERMMSILLLQSARLQKDAVLIKAAEANLANYGVNAGDIKGTMSKEEIDKTIKNDPTFALQRVGTQWENLTSKGVMQEMLVPVARGLNMVGDALERLANVNPEVARQFVEVGAAVIGLPTLFWGASTALNFFRTGWAGLITMASNPWFLVVAGAGYLIWKNWDWVSGFAQGAAPGLVRALDSITNGFMWIVDRGQDLLRFFGLIPAKTKDITTAFHAGAEAGKKLGDVLPMIMDGLAIMAGAAVFARVVTAIGSITTAVTGLNAAASTGFFARLLGAGSGSILAGAAAVVGTAAAANHINGLDTAEADRENNRVSKLPWGRWLLNRADPGLERMFYGAPKDDYDQRSQYQRVAPNWLGGLAAPLPLAPRALPPSPSPTIAPKRPSTPVDPGEGDASTFGRMFHRSSFSEDGDSTFHSLIHRAAYRSENEPAPSDMAGAAAASDAANIMRISVRQGVIEGLRAVLNLGARPGGIMNAGYDGSGFGGDGGGGGLGGGGSGGGSGNRANPSIRYGRPHTGSGGSGGGSGGGLPGSGRSIAARGALATNQKDAYAAARAEGLSDAAARALVANMSGESLANPKDYHWDGSHYSGGIVQWDPSRAAAIKAKFGKLPWQMSVAEQTKAAIWEIRNNKRFGATNRALQGSDPRAMVNTLVRNYEAPANPDADVVKRLGYLGGLRVGDGAGSGGGGDAGGGTGPLAGVAPDDKSMMARLQGLKKYSDQCVDLAKASVNAQNLSVKAWRAGERADAGSLKPGTPIATFLNRDGSQSSRYAGGGTGTPGAHLDHAAVFMRYVTDKDGNRIGMHLAEKYAATHGRVREKDYFFGRGSGEGNASNYRVILGPDGKPLGGSANPMSPGFAGALKPLGGGTGGDSDGPSGGGAGAFDARSAKNASILGGTVSPSGGGEAGRSVPGHLGGTLKIGDDTFQFGSGGKPGSKGSIPLGDYPLQSSAPGAFGQRVGGIGINNNRIWDSALKQFRDGIIIHGTRNAELLTHGCIGIQQQQFAALRSRIQKMIHDQGGAYLHVTKDGASITPNPGGTPAKDLFKSPPPSGGGSTPKSPYGPHGRQPPGGAHSPAAQAAKAGAGGHEARAAINAAAKAQATKASPGAGGTFNQNNTINVHPAPDHDERDIGRHTVEHLQEARNDGARLRSSTFDWQA